MYRQMAYPEKVDELRHVITAEEYVRHIVGKDASPFLPLPLRYRIVQTVLHLFVRIAKRLLGRELYVENKHRELILLEPRTRALLTRLMDEGVVRSWSRLPLAPDAPPIIGTTIDIHPTKLPDGRERHMGGSTGNGMGDTLEESFYPALGELLERYALTRWEEQDFVEGTYAELEDRGAVNPKQFVRYSDMQLKDPEYQRSIVDEGTWMKWSHARSLTDDTNVLIPAQLVHILYQLAFPDEPMFQATTSNSAAAGGSFGHAAYGAIGEAIERDSFLLFWLNRIAPPRIKVDTVPVPKVAETFNLVEQYGVRFELLDCTTDIRVPTFMSVCIDPTNAHPVSVNAVTDFDVKTGLEKLMRETVKFLHAGWRKGEGATDPKKITSIEERQLYWARPEMIKEMDFLLAGEERSFDACNFPSDPGGYTERLRTLAGIFREKDYSCYLVDVKSRQARKAGLNVVRAVIPELTPIYFNENRKHLNAPRLYSVPEKLGYTDTAKNENELNPVPHPFL